MKIYLVTYNGTAKSDSGEGYGSIYNLENACKSCGTGAELVSSIVVKGLKTSKLWLETLNLDILISKELYSSLLLANVKIDQLNQVRDYKSKNYLEYFHLNSKITFPTMRTDSEGIITEDQCQTCFRCGHFDDYDIHRSPRLHPRIYKYNLQDVQHLMRLSDVFVTWECFGASHIKEGENKVVRYARPSILIKENVKQLLIDMNVKNLRFEEVILVGQ